MCVRIFVREPETGSTIANPCNLHELPSAAHKLTQVPNPEELGITSNAMVEPEQCPILGGPF